MKGLDYVINLLDGSSEGAKHAKERIGEVDHAIAGAHERSNMFGHAMAELGAIVGGVFAAEKIIDFGKESLAAAKATRMASAQVEQAIATTGGVAGRSMEQLKKQAEDLENTTMFGDEQTLGAQSLLLTFTKIRGKIFDETIPAIQDLATRMGGDGPADLKGASVQIGKALNDPIQGLNALRRVGVSFTEQQKEQIKYMQEHNNLAGAQRMILAELNTEFGGSALAARKAAGPQQDLKVAYENLLKAVGPLIQNGIAPLVTWMAKGITVVTEWVGHYDEMVTGMKNGWQWIKKNADVARDLATGIAITTGVFLLANPMVIAYGAALVVNGAATVGLTAATYLMTGAMWLLDAAMTANPVGLLIVGIGLLIGGLIVAYHHSDTFRAILSGIGEVASELVPIFKGLGEIIFGALTLNPQMVIDGFNDAYNGVKKIIDTGGIGGAFNRGYDQSMSESQKKEAEEKKQEQASAAASKVGGEAGANHKLAGAPGKKAGTGTVAGLSSGTISNQSVASGKSVKNITITFQSMIKEFTMQVTNINGHDRAELKRFITQTIIEGASDAEILLGAE